MIERNAHRRDENEFLFQNQKIMKDMKEKSILELEKLRNEVRAKERM